MHYQQLVQTLKKHDRIVVTGPHRSGTTIATKMLALDLELPYFLEEEYKIRNVWEFFKLVQNREKFVVQAPSMASICHYLQDIDVVFMLRSLLDVLRSQERVNWTEATDRDERIRYFCEAKVPAASIKYHFWRVHQKHCLGTRAFELNYETAQGHALWAEKEDRAEFHSRQTEPNKTDTRPSEKNVEELKIDLGCGVKTPDGYIGIDIHAPNAPAICADICQPIPGLGDGCADRVRCAHVLEHLAGNKCYDVFKEIARLLRRGGIFEIRVPHPSDDNAMIHGHVCTLTPYWWKQMQSEDWLAGMLIIDSVTEVQNPEAAADIDLVNPPLPLRYLRNVYSETVVLGHKP